MGTPAKAQERAAETGHGWCRSSSAGVLCPLSPVLALRAPPASQHGLVRLQGAVSGRHGPFSSTSFPEPARPPRFSFREDLPLSSQLPALHRLLRAPHRVSLPVCPLRARGSATGGRVPDITQAARERMPVRARVQAAGLGDTVAGHEGACRLQSFLCRNRRCLL
ncbi:hypothetical protein SRHO_G00102810 [Serrasalmus rhombeus]